MSLPKNAHVQLKKEVQDGLEGCMCVFCCIDFQIWNLYAKKSGLHLNLWSLWKLASEFYVHKLISFIVFMKLPSRQKNTFSKIATKFNDRNFKASLHKLKQIDFTGKGFNSQY